MVASGALRHVAREHNFEDAYLFYCFDKRGHAGMCPEKWLHPAGSLCPVAGGNGAPRPRHHHRLVQIPDHTEAANETRSTKDAATGKSNSEDDDDGGTADECPHLTVASLHRTMA